MKRKTFFISFFVIAVLIIISGFFYFGDLFIEYVYIPPERIEPDTSVSVRATKVAGMSYSDYIACYGTIVSARYMHINSKTQGTAEKIHFNTGDFAKKGQLLLEIHNEAVKQRAINSILRYFKAIREQKALENISGGTDNDLDKIKNDIIDIIFAAPDEAELRNKLYQYVAGSKAAYPSDSLIAQEMYLYEEIDRLRSLRIYAPYDCIISETHVFDGMQINAGDRLYSVYSPSELQIRAEVSVIDFHKVKAGQTAIYTPIFGREEFFRAKVHSVSGQMDENNAFICNIDIIEGKDLIPGMKTRVFIEIEVLKDAIAVPNRCVLRSRDRSYVFVVRNDEAIWTDIETGNSNFSFTHIKSGLKEGDMVIYEGHYTLSHQAKITVIEEKDIGEFALLK